MVILLSLNLMMNFFSKSEKVILKRLSIIFTISIIIMIAFFGTKLNLDKTYTRDKFEQFYTDQNTDKYSNTKLKLAIGIKEIGIKTEKEYYISECMKLYNIFSTKVYVILGVHILFNILMIYQILKILKVQGKKDKMNRDEVILFDEEENVKF